MSVTEYFSRFETFMTSPAGRWTRVFMGLGLIGFGVFGRDRIKSGRWLAGVGLAPLIAGSADLCLLGPLFGQPLKGEELRKVLRHERVMRLPYPKQVDLEPAFE